MPPPRSRTGPAADPTGCENLLSYSPRSVPPAIAMTRPDPSVATRDPMFFTPVATAYRGANGWSAEVQRAFVAALARCGVVAAAARSVGRSPSSAYQLRRRPGAEGFARAWDAAVTNAGNRALDAAMEGGMVARRTEVFHRGRMVGWRTRYDDRLTLAALRTLDRREARSTVSELDAMMLFRDAMNMLEQRATCEASPAGTKA